MENEYCQFKDKKYIQFTPDIKNAQFFDSEEIAFNFIKEFNMFFSDGLQFKIYKIECLVLTCDILSA
jgi:hypothetical protein